MEPGDGDNRLVAIATVRARNAIGIEARQERKSIERAGKAGEVEILSTREGVRTAWVKAAHRVCLSEGVQSRRALGWRLTPV